MIAHWALAMLLLIHAGVAWSQNTKSGVCLGNGAESNALQEKSVQGKQAFQQVQLQIYKSIAQIDNAQTQAELLFIKTNNVANKKLVEALKTALEEMKAADKKMAVAYAQMQHLAHVASRCQSE